MSFVQLEVICGIILLVFFVVMLPLHVLTVHFRQFAPLRDVQPLLCLLTHGGFFMFTLHLFLSWHHEAEMCYALAIIQLFGTVLLYGCFIAKHYALHKRYRMVSSTLPTHIVFILAAFPFLMLCTYRVATRERDDCPNVEAIAGGCGLLIITITWKFFALSEHPSSHFERAKNVELVAMLFSTATGFIHQWVPQDGAVVPLLFLCGIAANACLLAYVLPPIRLALINGSEFTDEHYRQLNDSMFARSGDSYPDGVSAGEKGCGEVAVERIASCVRVICGYTAEDDDVNNSTFATNPTTPNARIPLINHSGSPPANHERNLISSSSVSTCTPAQRQELETQQELQELIGIIQEGDFYRLQRVMKRRGVALINLGDGNGRTPLHHAVRLGELNCIRYLHAMGADTNRFDAKGHAPLHVAVRYTGKTTGQNNSSGQIHSTDRSLIITELLRSGAGVNLPTAHGHTALHFAVQLGHLGAVNTLLRHDANPLINHDKEDVTLSWQQVHVTHCQSVVNDAALRKSPFTLAVEMGNGPIVSSMIHHMKTTHRRVHLDLRCAHGMTALHIALFLGNSAVAQVLLREGSCSPYCVNEETSMNVFHMVSMGDSALSMAYLLTQIGAVDLLPEQTKYATHAADADAAALALATTAATTTNSATNRRTFLAPLGSGVDQLLRAASTSSMPPSPAERPRQASFFGNGTAALKVQHGCIEPFFSTPQSMGFGEAMAVLRSHIPHASAEHCRVDELEAATDRVVSALRAKSNISEIERVHCALLVVTKRLKMASTRCVSGALMSTTSMPGTMSNAASFRPAADLRTTMLTVRDMLRQSDHIGMTPLHYAIQQRNVNLVHVMSAYGAVASEAERGVGVVGGGGDGGVSPQSGSDQGSDVDVPPDFGNATLCLGMMNSSGGLGDGGGRPATPDSAPNLNDHAGPDASDTMAFIGSLSQRLAGGANGASTQPDAAVDMYTISYKSFTRDVRRYVEDDEALQDVMLQAIRDGMSTYARFVQEQEGVGPMTPVS